MKKYPRKTNKLVVLLTEREFNILDRLYDEAVDRYGKRKASRARIVGALLMKVRDPLTRARNEREDLDAKLMLIEREIKRLEDVENER